MAFNLREDHFPSFDLGNQVFRATQSYCQLVKSLAPNHKVDAAEYGSG
jgi:hypothetical protein